MIRERPINPNPPRKNPSSTILPAPKRSVIHPSTGPSSAPPKRPKLATPDINARDQPYSSSIALKSTDAAWNVGPDDRNMLNAPAMATHHPNSIFGLRRPNRRLSLPARDVDNDVA